MDAKKQVGSRIKILRQARGYSQEKLAELIGINPKYLSSVERGAENPTLDLFIRLSEGLKVGLHEIFQTEHEGENPKQLRLKLKQLSTEIKDENLSQALRILEALTRG